MRIVRVFDTAIRTCPPIAVVMAHCQLTSTQARVACFIAMGLRPSSIATRLRITEATVRSHLKAIFQRLSCRSQMAVAVTVLDLTSPIGVPDRPAIS